MRAQLRPRRERTTRDGPVVEPSRLLLEALLELRRELRVAEGRSRVVEAGHGVRKLVGVWWEEGDELSDEARDGRHEACTASLSRTARAGSEQLSDDVRCTEKGEDAQKAELASLLSFERCERRSSGESEADRLMLDGLRPSFSLT